MEDKVLIMLSKLQDSFDKIELRIDKIEDNMNERFDSLESKVDKIDAKLDMTTNQVVRNLEGIEDIKDRFKN